MKKVILSILAIAALGTVSSAQQKMNSRKACPAASCTDHSYDHAYTSPGGAMSREQRVSGKACPAASCTDHSYDHAYTPAAADNPVNNGVGLSNREMLPARSSQAWTPVTTRTRDDAYSMNDYIFYGRYRSNGNVVPNPYNGDDAPSYDGAAKNAYRNMRANNESEPLPANNGQ